MLRSMVPRRQHQRPAPARTRDTRRIWTTRQTCKGSLESSALPSFVRMPGPPLARKPRDPFRSKGRLVDTRAQRRGRKAPRPGGEKPRRGGPLAIGALIASVAATLLLSAWNISWQRSGKARADRATLEAAAAKPLKYTDHALCRMDCRHSYPLLPAETAQSEPAWLSHFLLAARFIREQQVRTALQTGSINHRKSEPRLQPCPKLVVDAHVGKSLQARCASGGFM